MELKKEDVYKVIPKDVIAELFEDFELDIEEGVHGFSHWARVIDNGMFLSEENGANKNVLIAFGLFHDVKRENDRDDPDHGFRGGQLLKKYKDRVNLTEEEIEKVIEACSGHTDEMHHEDLDIGTCWDSDRLDLYRVGIYPEPEYLNNEYAMQEEVIEMRSERAEWEEMSPWACDIFDEIIQPMLNRKEEAENELNVEELFDIIKKKDTFNPWVDCGDTVKIKVFHGTTEDKVASIRKEGLKSVVNDPNWYMLSTNFGGALYHSNADRDKSAVVLEMELEFPKPEFDFLWNGNGTLYPEYKHEDRDMSWFALSDVVSPDTIKKIHTVDFDCFVKQKQKGFEDLEHYELKTKVLSNKNINKSHKLKQ